MDTLFSFYSKNDIISFFSSTIKSTFFAFSASFNKFCLYSTKILPKVEESYDLAIAYSAPVSLALYYVAYNIKANKKWTWIHNEVDQITVDIRDAKNVFQE